MRADPTALYPGSMDVAWAMTTAEKGGVLVLICAVAAPIAGFMFARAHDAWSSLGKDPFSIGSEEPTRKRSGPPPRVDPAIQAAEVRQMLQAKSERRQRRGEAALDVEAETDRLLAAAEAPAGREAIDTELRAEVRQLVVARNERRLRQGLEPLDVEAETDRQLADFIGSP
jgi:hypothetical protein